MCIQAISFDMDGLLFNTEDLYSVVETEFLSRRNQEVNDKVTRQMMGRPASQSIAIMIRAYQLTETMDQVLAEMDEIFDELLPTRLALMPGARELLRTVDELGIPKAITTSSRRVFLDRLLELSNLEFQFDFFLTSENVKNGKPHPEIYLTSASQFGVPAGQMVAFEDSEIGCQAAVASGAIAIAVPSVKSRNHSFDGAQLVCESLADPRIGRLMANET